MTEITSDQIASLAWAKLTGTPTTLAGYGIVNAQPLDATLTAVAALPDVVGVLTNDGTGAVSWWTPASVNTAFTLVMRDGSGNFAAGTITASLAGNATTASTLTTPRAINGVNFDGSAAITVTAAAGTLTGTTLAATVVTSSLTTVGALGAGSITSGFGAIDVGADAITGGAITGTTGTFSSNVLVTGKVGIGVAAVHAQSLLYVGSTSETQLTVHSDTGNASGDTDAYLRFVIDGGAGTLKGLMGYDQGLDRFVLGMNGSGQMRIDSSGNLEYVAKTTKYNNLPTAGWGIPAVYGSARVLAQTGSTATTAGNYTVGNADGSFVIAVNVFVTTATSHNFNVQVTYTDESNAVRVLLLPVVQIGGVPIVQITNTTGVGPYHGLATTIRCKANTVIQVKTVGTFTTVTYNVEGTIIQIT
jgi:hypothetical protein